MTFLKTGLVYQQSQVRCRQLKVHVTNCLGEMKVYVLMRKWKYIWGTRRVCLFINIYSTYGTYDTPQIHHLEKQKFACVIDSVDKQWVVHIVCMFAVHLCELIYSFFYFFILGFIKMSLSKCGAATYWGKRVKLLKKTNPSYLPVMTNNLGTILIMLGFIKIIFYIKNTVWTS